MMKDSRRLAVMLAVMIVCVPTYSRTMDQSKTCESGQVTVTVSNVQQIRNVENKTQKVLDQKTSDGAYWFKRGYELHYSDRVVEAIDAFAQSIGHGYRQATSMYNIACGFSRLNDNDNALFWLERAFAMGFDQVELLKTDSDLDPIRSDPRFDAMARRLSASRPAVMLVKDGGQKERSRVNEAIANFDRLQGSASSDGDQWYKVGSRLLSVREFDRAIVALSQAVEHLGYRGASAMYNLACTYSLMGDVDSGLKWLERSVNAGFDSTHKLANDPDLANLEGNPRFRQIEELSRTLSLSQFNQHSDGESQYSKQRWAPAVRLYESFLKGQPTNGRGWFNFGYALHYSGDHSKAIDAFKRAIDFGYKPPTSTYNIACANAMAGNKDAAFEWLDKAAEAGFDLEGYITSDRDLESLRSDARFARFVDMADGQHKGDYIEKHKEEKRKEKTKHNNDNK
jgi:tetratricopeptide (TPR) repeat protein